MDSTKKAYLIVYNGLQTFGWASILIQTVFHLVTRGTLHNLYDHTHQLLAIFQTMAVLEVVHAVTGVVRSNFFLTAMQVASREFLTWGILFAVPQSRQSPGLILLLLAWSITEVVRYSFYTLQQIDSVPHGLLWCRYNFFLVLYPAGVLGEMLCAISAIDPVCSGQLFSVAMPNRWNVTFSYCIMIYVILLTYAPGFPQLFFHMLAQRKKFMQSTSPSPTDAERKQR